MGERIPLLIRGDMALFASGKSRAATLLFLACLMTVPLYASSYLLDVMNRIGIAVIAALGLNILTGFTGLISLGNAAFMAIGAFGASWLALRTGINFLFCIPAAGLITAALGMVVGIPSLRLRGLYLAMATLAAHFIVEFLAVHWESVTGGVAGLSIAPPTLAGIALDSDRTVFFIIIPTAACSVLFVSNIFRTKVGRAFIAIRDQEMSAAVMGIDVFRYKLISFALSSFFAGVAGALMACQTRIITPENFPISIAIDSLAMIIIGGLGSVIGTIFGAVFLTALPEFLRLGTTALAGSFPELIGKLASLKELVFGLLVILFLIFEPHGLSAIWHRVKNRF
ncbi:MAG TPA: branched-chain amino acid ABC transporter permease [Dongiaceae bacterium]|nr:branched-chain amino acid ABC transporter permease [Dongiaceae bacterium]